MEKERIRKKKSWLRRAKHRFLKFIHLQFASLSEKLTPSPKLKRRRKRKHNRSH